MTWAEEHVTLAVKLFTDGLTASQIAAKLKKVGGTYSRNAVIGKLTRLGHVRGRPASPSRAGIKIGAIGGAGALAKAKTRAAEPQAERAMKPRQIGDGLAAINIMRKAERTAHSLQRNGPLRTIALVGDSTPRPWTTRRFGECAAPVSGEGAETHSCCAPVDGDSAWCAAHRAQFCVPNKKRLNVGALARVA